MARSQLTGGAYTARSLIAGAQSCINLIPEEIPRESGEPASVVYLPTPGLSLFSVVPAAGCRGLHRTATNILFAVYGGVVFTVSAVGAVTIIGGIEPGTSRVSMADNGVILALVDGTAKGYQIDLTTFAMTVIVDDAFYGADYVDFFATYFLFNKPGAPQFYVSDSEALTFDSLYFANAANYQDLTQAIIQVRGAFALIGQTHTEWWTTSGASDFPYQSIPTAVVENGTEAKYSVAKTDTALFWLSSSLSGTAIAMIARGYTADRISTHAVEVEWQSYSTVSDAIGWTYQLGGHTCYVLTFPSADRTWVFDIATGWWHQWGAFDGITLHRHVGHSSVQIFGKVLVGDSTNGNLYVLDNSITTDNGTSVTRQRTFPHMIQDGRRVTYTRFQADMQCGGSDADSPVTLSWSDDRGATFPGQQSLALGSARQGNLSLQFRRLGMARDRVFRLTFGGDSPTALMGAWIDTEGHRT